MAEKDYFTFSDLKEKLSHLYDIGVSPGVHIGFECLRELYTVKLGTFTLIGGYPSHGKTEFLLEILMNTAQFYGWRHGVFTPETGEPDEVAAELESKWMRKAFGHPGHQYRMGKDEHYRAMDELEDQFFIVNNNVAELTVDKMLSVALKLKKEKNIDTFTIDPWNDLTHRFERQDVYLEEVLVKIRKFCHKHNMHFFILMHPRTKAPVEGKLPVPTFHDYSGGGAWASKGFSIICMYRPDTGNRAEVIMQKVKPKCVGKKGDAVLYFDWKTSRYYEKVGGLDRFASKDISEKQHEKLIDYSEPTKIEDDDQLPF
jgi:hypothetical protein